MMILRLVSPNYSLTKQLLYLALTGRSMFRDRHGSSRGWED